MTNPRKDDQDIEETKRIMERLVNTPHTPHKPAGNKRPDKSKLARASLSDQNLKDRSKPK